MYCYKCGEENPDEAKFCKNCGTLLKEEEKAKKVEVIEHPIHNQNSYQQTGSSTTSSNTNSSDNSNWVGCCLCIVVIFVLFSILGMLGL